MVRQTPASGILGPGSALAGRSPARLAGTTATCDSNPREKTRSRHCQRREGVDVRDHVDDDGAVGLERLTDGGAELGRLLDPDAERAHVLGDACEADLAEGP